MELRRAGKAPCWDTAIADAMAGNLTPLLAMLDGSSVDDSAMDRFLEMLAGVAKGADWGECDGGRGYGAIILSASCILGGCRG